MALGVAACVVEPEPGLPAIPTADRTPQPPTVTPAATPEPRPTAPTPHRPAARESSTLALIDAALARGEITPGQRLLYLTYAIYEYDSLPAQFRSDAGWRGTSIVRELKAAVQDPQVMCGLTPEIQSELRRLLRSGVSCPSGT
jgi:hypothetical protein